MVLIVKKLNQFGVDREKYNGAYFEVEKFLLYDDFACWDEGEYIGQVSGETIAKMPKTN